MQGPKLFQSPDLEPAANLLEWKGAKRGGALRDIAHFVSVCREDLRGPAIVQYQSATRALRHNCWHLGIRQAGCAFDLYFYFLFYLGAPETAVRSANDCSKRGAIRRR